LWYKLIVVAPHEMSRPTEPQGPPSEAFADTFRRLTDHIPYPWQSDLYGRLCAGRIPRACVVPTGLGKTSVVAIWLLARRQNPELPRRLVYVVNRRTVVDQTTDEVETLRRRLPELGMGADDLAVSTLRGQFADNREWSADPSRPAVICGTVDMIGSRLLFSGYGIGFKGRPLHAGFLGQDVLLVHDEAHLEEPFQRLATSIEEIQDGFEGECPATRLHVMALTATPRGAADPLNISASDRAVASDRLDAAKHLKLVPVAREAEVFTEIVDSAHALHERDRSVLVFVRTVDGVKKVVEGLKRKKVPEDRIDQLTGTIRGKERDALVTRPVFRRFLPNPQQDVTGTVYLVCTSAGEVGVNISADDLVCDLAPFDSMAQRFGRVNRFGKLTGPGASIVTVVHPTEFDEDKPIEQRRQRTLELLGRLLETVRSVSPNALESLSQEERESAFTPAAKCLPLTDILVDAWSFTSIRSRMPGRPPVEPYLHGVAEHEQPETRVGWREEVAAITEELYGDHPPRDLLEAYELKPHELLRDTSRRVFEELRTLAQRFGDRPVWLLDEFGDVDTRHTLLTLTARDEAPIRNRTVLLPHDVGGLDLRGMLDGNAQAAGDPERPIDNDVADEVRVPETGGKAGEPPQRQRIRVDRRDHEAARGMRLVRTIRWPDNEDVPEVPPRVWYWFEWPSPRENSRHAIQPVALVAHVADVEEKLNDILSRLPLDDSLASVLRLAARWHDQGKRRERWQASIGRPEGLHATWFAKSGRGWVSRREGAYRHEFGSLLDVTRLEECAEFTALDYEKQDLVLHLVGCHHGMARPHFDPDQMLDPNHPLEAAEAMGLEVPRRFARLQRRFGHWGLAYIESLFRAADWHASASPSRYFPPTD
jgi:CRISPR-associated endonuclease/helicase Cas3